MNQRIHALAVDMRDNATSHLNKNQSMTQKGLTKSCYCPVKWVVVLGLSDTRCYRSDIANIGSGAFL